MPSSRIRASSPSWASACRPRAEIARLMLRPSAGAPPGLPPSVRGSPRRSSSSTAWPACPSSAASSEPTSPPPTTTKGARPGRFPSGIERLRERGPGPPDVVERVVQWYRCHPDDVRLPEIGYNAAGPEGVEHGTGAFRHEQRELTAPGRGIARGDDLDAPTPAPAAQAVDEELEVPGERHRLGAERRHAGAVELRERHEQRRQGEDRRIGELPAVGAFAGDER